MKIFVMPTRGLKTPIKGCIPKLSKILATSTGSKLASRGGAGERIIPIIKFNYTY